MRTLPILHPYLQWRQKSRGREEGEKREGGIVGEERGKEGERKKKRRKERRQWKKKRGRREEK